MPIHRQGSGWEWGNHGKVYSNRADAVRQAEAAHANGYTGHKDGGLVMDEEEEKKMRRWQIKNGLRNEIDGVTDLHYATGGQVENVRNRHTFALKNAAEANSRYPGVLDEARNRAKQDYLNQDRTEEQKQSRYDKSQAHNSVSMNSFRPEEDHAELREVGGYADGGKVDDMDFDPREDFEPEMEMVGDKGEIDSILDSVISMCEDPECDYEFAEQTNAIPSSVEPQHKDKSDMPPIEIDKDEDQISRMADELHQKKDEQHHSFGMRRTFRQ